MADIQQYLQNFLKIEESDALALGVTPDQPLHKVSNETYKIHDEKYIISNKSKEMLQYATFYWLRLQSLKPHVREAAEMKWEQDGHITYVNNILDIRPN